MARYDDSTPYERVKRHCDIGRRDDLTDEERMRLRLGIIPERLKSYCMHTPKEALRELGRRNKERKEQEVRQRIRDDAQEKAPEKKEPTTRREAFFQEYGIEPVILPE